MSNLFTSTYRTMASCCIALSLAIGISAQCAALAADPQGSVRGFYVTLLATMKDGQTLGESGRYARLAPVIGKLFDVPLMARLAVGPSCSRAVLDDAFSDPAATGYRRLRTLHLGNIRRPFR
jgi:hypothetical protein